MRIGFGVLRLPPNTFWAMTPRELHAACEALAGGARAAPPRSRLNELMRLFPDAAR